MTLFPDGASLAESDPKGYDACSTGAGYQSKGGDMASAVGGNLAFADLAREASSKAIRESVTSLFDDETVAKSEGAQFGLLMKLRPEARERLRESFGPDWVVLDFHNAPDTADVVLTAAYSPQLIHRWTLLFPQAQIIVTEILDNEFGLDVGGPVGRLMDAGAHAYLPPRPLEQVAQNVQSYLESRAPAELGSAAPAIHQIGS
ncbi:MAG: hypothetical protein ABWZ91_06480 [Nocardioides sp.]